MKPLERTLAVFAAGTFLVATMYLASCGGGHSNVGGGGTGIQGETTFEGNLSSGNDQVSGVQICIEGTDPLVCVTTDENGNFTISADVAGQIVLAFTMSDSSASLCLSGVPNGATVTLEDISCTVSDGTCVPQNIGVDPTPSEPIQVCNAQPTPTPTPTPGGGPTDSDGDGVANETDLCPDTPAEAIVNSDGCSLDQLAPCAGPAEGGSWYNHGEYVSTVADVSKQFEDAGLITADQRNAIVGEAADSDCGKPHDSEPTPTPGPEVEPTPGENDDDGDGVQNPGDQCSDTPSGEVVDSSGCSISQLVPCDGEWKNHGEYVAAVADVSRNFEILGLITHQERSLIVRDAAQSDCGRDGEPDDEL